MQIGLIFISYHPGSLPDYDYIARIDHQESKCILIICRHPYTSDEIIQFYSQKFNRTIILPDIHYEPNIVRGFVKYHQFMKNFRKEIEPAVRDMEYYHIISDCSAYLPVNALLSELTKNEKCRNLISLREDHDFGSSPNILKTLRSRLYTALLGLYPVYDHQIFSHMYYREPRDKIVKIVSPYVKNRGLRNFGNADIPIYYIYKNPVERNHGEKKTVIFYGDTQLDNFHDLSKEEFKKRLQRFFLHLAQHYRNCKIVCKPHPQDQGKVMMGIENISYELYSGSLTSQMHLDLFANEVRACYSVSSSSLLSSAAMGIPSYTLYQYLDFKGEYPNAYFENDEIRENPFLYNVKDLSEMGIIDNLTVEPKEEEPQKIWNEALK